MNAKKVDYPAKLVGFRIDVVNDRIVLFEDIPVLFNDRELERRIGTYRALDAAGASPTPSSFSAWRTWKLPWLALGLTWSSSWPR